jgi:hypothetical protein
MAKVRLQEGHVMGTLGLERPPYKSLSMPLF